MTLTSLLHAERVPAADVVQAIAAAQAVFDPRRVHTDHPYRLVQTLDGALRRFEYEIDADRFLRVARSRGDCPCVASIGPITKTQTTSLVMGSHWSRVTLPLWSNYGCGRNRPGHWHLSTRSAAISISTPSCSPVTSLHCRAIITVAKGTFVPDTGPSSRQSSTGTAGGCASCGSRRQGERRRTSTNARCRCDASCYGRR